MPKHEALTPKAIANRIKAKGLQKLRWYCQMCQKQCRDENGFKCHTMSESHQRQLLLFADNPHKYLDTFSQEFERDFLHLLSRRFGTRRVSANQVYQEYIADRHHLHMNSTKWETLTGFVKWLGRQGKCVVDQTEKGWFVTYVDRDPDTIRRQEALAKKERMEKDDDERMADFIGKQVQRAKAQSRLTDDDEPRYSGLEERDGDDKVVFKLPPPKPAAAAERPRLAAGPSESKGSGPSESKRPADGRGEKRKCALDEIMEEQETTKEKMNRKDHWITEGIVVKILTGSLGDKYRGKKAVIEEVKGKYAAIVRLLDGGDVLKLDQAHLETVIPAKGRAVRVVNGAYRGQEAALEDLDRANFCCTVRIRSGAFKGRAVEGVRYEDVSKLHAQS